MPATPLLIAHDADACRSCLRCACRCPARAVRVGDDGTIGIIAEKCVRCGLCVSECPHGAWVVRDDGDAVDALLRGERPVVALLATEFVAALHPLSAAAVESMLHSAGFFAVESTLLGEEAVAAAYEVRHTSGSGLPVIRSTCPVVNDWVRLYHPALTGALAPLVPPYIAQARLIREMYEEDVAIVYVSPCYARKDEALEPEFEGVIDVAIDFLELGRALARMESVATHPTPDGEPAGMRRPEPLKEISLTDGYPRSTFESRDMTATDVRVVRGLAELDELLRAVEAGESAPHIIDALNCEGCLDGPAVGPGLSLFAKRHLATSERGGRARPRVSSREILRNIPHLDLRRSFEAAPVRLPVPGASELRETLRAGGMDVQPLDCGMCGLPSCEEFAISVCRGETTWAACLPHRSSALSSELQDLEESASLDPVTGLWNRRVLEQRLGEEFARHARSGGRLSLLMLDVDRFKSVNDRFGHAAGDAVLARVAELLRASLRTADIPVRYGGDEFAVVLPDTGKTEAFAVAEKLRLEIEGAMVEAEGLAGGPMSVEIRVSIGVGAASGGVGSPEALLEAADRALYRAKEGGRNQVRLAPG
jgi:diguanylate cyclase (GGDEF)-like protein